MRKNTTIEEMQKFMREKFEEHRGRWTSEHGRALDEVIRQIDNEFLDHLVYFADQLNKKCEMEKTRNEFRAKELDEREKALENREQNIEYPFSDEKAKNAFLLCRALVAEMSDGRKGMVQSAYDAIAAIVTEYEKSGAVISSPKWHKFPDEKPSESCEVFVIAEAVGDFWQSEYSEVYKLGDVEVTSSWYRSKDEEFDDFAKGDEPWKVLYWMRPDKATVMLPDEVKGRVTHQFGEKIK